MNGLRPAAPSDTINLNEIDDTAVRDTDPVGGAANWGNCQPIAAGPWPDLGLPDEPWM